MPYAAVCRVWASTIEAATVLRERCGILPAAYGIRHTARRVHFGR
ncbi:MAG: hypothetical protein ACR2L2_18375 [Acidobacteriota bacterium]